MYDETAGLRDEEEEEKAEARVSFSDAHPYLPLIRKQHGQFVHR
jgi:hypothetical protein